MQLGEQILQS